MKGRLADSFFTSEDDAQPQPAASQPSTSMAAPSADTLSPIFTTPVRRSKIPQPPKKGILKRPPAQNYSEQYIQPSMADIVYIKSEVKKPSILERFMMIQALVDPLPSSAKAAAQPKAASANSAAVRPTVEFSERNVVAIIGDTSDDCTTEAHEPQTPLTPDFSLPKTTPTNGSRIDATGRTRLKNVVSPIRQPNIFFSEDSEESSEAAAVHLRHHHQQQQNSDVVGLVGSAERGATFRPSPLAYSSASISGTAPTLGPIEEDGSTGARPSSAAAASSERTSFNPQAQRAMFDSMSTTEDDSHSVTSSNGSANIVGKWWNGKSTRYVLHCDKRGCSHKHSPDELTGGDYLTPTQRKNREIAVFSHQLKRCEAELEAKNKQLAQFRERLKEIETMMASSQALSENVRLVQRQSEREAEFREERTQLIKRHEMRVRQLIQETVEARTEMLKKTKQLERLKAEIEVEKIERSCMTDQPLAPSSPPVVDVTPRKVSAVSHVNAERVALTAADVGAGGNVDGLLNEADPPAIVYDTGQQLQIALTQVEAYRNEALIWRTKAAQLEIVLKEFVAQAEEEEQEAVEAEAEAKLDAEAAKTQEDALPDPPASLQRITKSMSFANLRSLVKQTTVKFSGRNASRFGSEAALGPVMTGECRSAACADQRRKLANDTAELKEKVENQIVLIDKLEDEKAELHSKYGRRKSELTALEALHGKLVQLAEARLAEVTAAQDSLARLQTECANFKKAISYLESRCQVFQNVILDHGLIVRDDGGVASKVIAAQLTDGAIAAAADKADVSAELRHGFADPDYVVYYSKGVQTTLTSASLDMANEDFFVLRRKLEEVEAELSTERHRSVEQLADVRKSIRVKSALVEQLTGKMHELIAREKRLAESHQQERDIYRDKIEQLSRIAERVPILESEIDLALKAKSQLELAFRRSERDFGDQMEAALADALNRRTEADVVWAQRVAFADETRRDTQAHLERLQRDIGELRLRHSVEKAELEERLTSSIRHITELNNKLNYPKCDAECETKPKTTNKYVSCRPSQRVKDTQIEIDDLPDAPELFQCRAELMKRVYQLPFADDKVKRLEKLLDALATVQKKQQTPISARWLSVAAPKAHRSADCVTFCRDSDAVHISLRGASSAPALAPSDPSEPKEEDEKISTISSQAALVNALLEGVAVLSPAATFAPPCRNEVFTRLAQFAAQKSDEVKRLKIDNDRLESEIHLLKERLFEMENDAYVKNKDRVAHVSYLISTKIEYDSCDNIELAVKLTDAAGRQRPVPLTTAAEKSSQCIGHPRSLTVKSADLGDGRRERAASFSSLHDSVALGKLKTDIHRPISSERLSTVLMANKPELNLALPQQGTVVVKSLAPSKWDFERNALIKRNAQLSDQLTRLKHDVEAALQRRNSFKRQIPTIIHTAAGENSSDEDALMILKTVCAELDELLNTDNLQYPLSDSARVRAECDALQRQLHDAHMELEIYRKRPRTVVTEAPKRWQSAVDLKRSDSASMASRELARWKEMARVMFRELNYLRAAASTSEAQRLEIKTTNAMLHDEIKLAKCQNALVKELAQRRRVDGRRFSLGPDGHDVKNNKLRRNASLNYAAEDIDQQITKTQTPAGAQSSSFPNLSEFFELAERRAIKAQTESDMARIGTQRQHLTRRGVSAASGAVAIEVTKTEEALRKELDIIREAFHAQARRFRSTNRDLERRVSDLKARVRDQPNIDEMTEHRVMLKFLHDAFYYYLINKGNARELLQAILTMLNFTNAQKAEIYQRRGKSH